MKRSLLILLACAALGSCSAPREISILESRLQSDPERYRDRIVRVHLRSGVELVAIDEAASAMPTLLLQRTDHPDPVVSCSIEWGMAGGTPGGFTHGAFYSPGMLPKRVPVHDVNHVIELDRFDFADEDLIAVVRVPDGAAHRYFLRVPGIGCDLAQPCVCIHPGYRELDQPFRVVIPRELIYRYSGRDPASAPAGSGTHGARTRGGFLDSGLGLPSGPDAVLTAPQWALRHAASGQDSLAIATVRDDIREITRNMVVSHDALYDHYVALLSIHVVRGDYEAAADAAAHLMHFARVDFDDLTPAVVAFDHASPFAAFSDTRGPDLVTHGSDFLEWWRGDRFGPDCHGATLDD